MSVITPTRELHIETAEEAAEIAIINAQKAADNKTFGIGCLLIANKTKDVLAISLNEVIHNGKVTDPTGHAERQLVDWYFDQTLNKKRDLPPPHQLTVVSSLDPCMMCCGALLTGGFNVISIALDRCAGVNYNGSGNFAALPDELKLQAKKLLSYSGVTGEWEFIGHNPLLAGTSIAAETAKRSIIAFHANQEKVRKYINNNYDLPPEQIQNPKMLPQKHPVVKKLHQYDDNTLTITTNYNLPGGELLKALIDKARAAKAAKSTFNSAALVDTFGNILLTMGGNECHSPIRTAFMELTRAYNGIRADLGEEGATYLPHPKYLKVISLIGPGRDSLSVMDLGAYGSTVEGPIPSCNKKPLQYTFLSSTHIDEDSLTRMVQSFPPLYSHIIGINPVKVANKEFVMRAKKEVKMYNN